MGDARAVGYLSGRAATSPREKCVAVVTAGRGEPPELFDIRHGLMRFEVLPAGFLSLVSISLLCPYASLLEW